MRFKVFCGKLRLHKLVIIASRKYNMLFVYVHRHRSRKYFDALEIPGVCGRFRGLVSLRWSGLCRANTAKHVRGEWPEQETNRFLA